MGKVKELASLLSNITNDLEVLHDELKDLTELLSADNTEATEPASPQQIKKVLSIEEVRAVLSKKVAAEVQALLKSYGVKKLSEINPAEYDELLRAAETLPEKEANNAT